jgi:glycine betaine/proline transport system ATP-binding protein
VGEFTKHIPRAKVLTVGSVMSKDLVEGTETVSASARIEDIADKVESAGIALPVLDADGQPVGSIRPSTIIDVLVGREVVS